MRQSSPCTICPGLDPPSHICIGTGTEGLCPTSGFVVAGRCDLLLPTLSFCAVGSQVRPASPRLAANSRTTAHTGWDRRRALPESRRELSVPARPPPPGDRQRSACSRPALPLPYLAPVISSMRLCAALCAAPAAVPLRAGAAASPLCDTGLRARYAHVVGRTTPVRAVRRRLESPIHAISAYTLLAECSPAPRVANKTRGLGHSDVRTLS